MRIEDIRACEGIMRDVPKMKASLASMERASQGSLFSDVRVQGGGHLPAAVRLAEDMIRCGTIEAIDVIYDAIEELDDEMRDIVIDVYFLGRRHEDAAGKLHLSRRTITRRCRDAIERIAPKVLPLYGKVIAWRNRWEEEVVRTWTREV